MNTLQTITIRCKELLTFVSGWKRNKYFLQTKTDKYEWHKIAAIYHNAQWCVAPNSLRLSVTFSLKNSFFVCPVTTDFAFSRYMGPRIFFLRLLYIFSIRSNCYKILEPDGVDLQNVHQSYFKTPVCSASSCKRLYATNFR